MNEKEMRELDAWIAEHVMGWKWFAFPPVTDGTRKWTILLKTSSWQRRQGGKQVSAPHKNDEIDIGSVPQYTTDPAAAMEVLRKIGEEMGGRTYGLRIHGPSAEFKVHFWTVTDDEFDVEANAPTLELAICLFAKQLFSKEAQ
jgi:hypothetical protein